MATLRKRKISTGFSFQVRWRDRDNSGEETSKTFDNLREATLFKDFLNSNNQSLAYATKSAKKFRSTAPKITNILETHFKTLIDIQPDTLWRYKQLSANHIIPTIGSIPVDQFTVEDAQDWFINLSGCAKTKKNIQAILSAAFKTAIKKDVIKTNPIIGLKSVREVVKRKPIFLTTQQINQLVTACCEQYSLLLEFLIVSGLRWGEATALQRKDLRLEENQIVVSVYKAWKKMPGKTELGAPKTKASVRDVSLSEDFSKKLLEHAKNLQGEDLVFCNPNTKGRISNDTFYVLAWHPALAKCDFFDKPRVHDLRHTHASMLIAAGVPLPVIQKRLGHESIVTTVDVYGHLAIGADKQAANAIQTIKTN